MSSGYQVETGGMHGLVDTLDGAARSMADATGALGDAPPQNLGNAELDAAGRDFQKAWRFGIGQLGELTGHLSEQLGEVVRTYDDMERDAAEVFASEAPGDETASGGSGPSRITRALSGGQP
jgi:hypothetical protein